MEKNKKLVYELIDIQTDRCIKTIVSKPVSDRILVFQKYYLFINQLISKEIQKSNIIGGEK